MCPEAAKLKMEQFEAKGDALQAELDQFDAAKQAAERQMRTLTQEVTRIESRIDNLTPKTYVRQAKPPPDKAGVAKQAADLIGAGICNHIKILGLAPQH